MQIRNEAENLKPVPAVPFTQVTAGGSGDDTKITGLEIDRTGFDSALLNIVANLNVADTETLSVEVEIQDKVEGGSWLTAEVIQADAVVFTSDGGDTDTLITIPVPIGLAKYNQYVRVNATPNLSASGTDTADIMGELVLADSNVIPLQLGFTAIS